MLLPGSVKNVVGDAGALPRSASAPGVFVFLVVLLAGVAGSIVTLPSEPFASPQFSRSTSSAFASRGIIGAFGSSGYEFGFRINPCSIAACMRA